MYNVQQLWIELRSSLWFVPSLLVVGSIFLAVGLVQVDEAVDLAWLDRWSRLFGAGAEGSRSMLGAIATSMITVAGVTFSITVAALAQASGQYSPLVLRNFMRDRTNQVVLGVFGGIFVYCLIVLRSIRSGADEFVPTIAVTVALLHALAGIGFLLLFIHHIATVLQASSILSIVYGRTVRAIDDKFTETIGADDDQREDRSGGQKSVENDGVWQPITPHRTGYIQSITTDNLIRLACEHDAVVCNARGIGDFVMQDLPFAWVRFGGHSAEDALDRIRDQFIISDYRTIEQDVAFGMRQIVDVALKALSPGINDPTTACSCIDYLSAILVRLADRRLPASEHYAEGHLRLIATGPTFAELAGLALDQIRSHARGDAAVLTRLVGAIEIAGAHVAQPARRRLLLQHLTLTAAHAARCVADERERNEIAMRIARAARAIEAGHEAHTPWSR